MDRSNVEGSVLAVRGELVVQLTFDFALTVVTDSSAIRIEVPFTLLSDGQSPLTIDPAAPAHGDELLRLHQSTLNAACLADGTLEMKFSIGPGIRVDPHPEYEAWTLTRQDGELFVALPGGGLSTFGHRSSSSEE